MLMIKQPRHSLGFSLIESLIAIVVIGILAAIAIPSYRYYTTKSRVAEGLELADASRTKIMLARSNGDSLSSNFELLNEPTGHVSSIKWVAVPNTQAQGDTVIGYILPTMDLPGLGLRDAFALELTHNGQWRCINAAAAINHNAASAHKTLDNQYLPANCQTGAAFLAQHNSNCQSQTQIADANGNMQTICAPNSPQPQQTSRQSPQSPQAPQAAQGTPSPQSQRPHTCVQGQNCPGRTPQCPPGQEYAPADRLRIRDRHDPFSSNMDSVFKVTMLNFQGGCVAKCANGMTFNPSAPTSCVVAPATHNHTCNGPKYICERSHRPQEACPIDAPYAASNIENLADGNRYVTKSCLTQHEAFEAAKYNREHPECANYNPDKAHFASFQCTYPCITDGCNAQTVPTSQVSWGPGKTEADLPDNWAP